MEFKLTRTSIIAAFLIPFVIACAAPVAVVCVTTSGKPQEFSGLWLLGIGFLGPLLGQFAWYANVSNVAAVGALLMRNYRTSIGFSILTLLLSCDTFAWFKQEVYLDEGGVNRCLLQSFGLGSFFWLLSLLAPLIIAVASVRSQSAAREKSSSVTADI